jgi:tetratricopeptide (TPR) repeat protein
VLPLGTDYEEQEQDVEIVNFSRSSGINSSRITGHVNESRDFYLTPRRVATGLSAPGTVFAQDVPENAKKLYKEGLAHLDEKRMNEGYSSIKQSIEVFPKYFAALETLGVEYVRAGHFAAAQVLLTIAVDINPRAYKSWYGLARSLNSQNKQVEALNAAEKAIELNGLAPESLFLAGTLSRQAKDYAKAEKHLSKAREVSEDVIPDIHWELALLYGNGLKRYKEAAKELRTYLKAVPDDKNAENIKKLIAEFEEKAKTS